MAGLKYQLLKLISHPVSAFFFFGSVVFSAALFVIYHDRQAEWDTQRHNLDSIINIYQSYNTGGEVKDSDIRFLTGDFTQVRVRTLGFNTRDTQPECITHLSQLDLTFNDMTILRLCKDKLPAMGQYAGKGAYTTIFPLMSPLDELHGVIIRTTGVLSEPTLYKTVRSFSSLLIAAFMALLAAMLGSVLSLFAKKYLIELPTTARYDDLTGYLRRDAFYHAANKVLQIANVTRRPTCVILIDIDHFKNVNDTLGHDGGDDALKTVAAILKNSFRKEEIFGRLGGDEFAIVLPNIALDDAYWVAERARVAVSNATSASSSGQKMKLSVSIGLVEYHIAQEDLTQVMKRADEKLYLAKRERNRVAL
ncbi:MAG: GGDEF domain-containing protein [Candidatus Symbiopectobacterium sp. Dall1.0]|nr:GGDEF domain-containing protein [Candidatus Symbiopectobacterium sp. Dall1.0]